MERIVEIEKFTSESELEKTLRPDSWDDYIGQEQLKKSLAIFVEAALKRGEPLDHSLFHGFPLQLDAHAQHTVIFHEAKKRQCGKFRYALRRG